MNRTYQLTHLIIRLLKLINPFIKEIIIVLMKIGKIKAYGILRLLDYSKIILAVNL